MSRQWRSDDTEKWTYGFGNGSDGDLTISSNTTETVIDSSCSGTAGSTSLTATNASFAAGQFIIIHQTRGTEVGQWELAKISAYTAGTITTDKNLQYTYTDSGASQAQVRVQKQYNNVTINSGVTYTAKAWDGNVGGLIGWFAKGTTTVTGTLSATGRGFRGGEGIGGSQAQQAEGTAGAGGTTTTAANGNGGGGGNQDGGNGSSGGGGGGHAAAGTTGSLGTGSPTAGVGGAIAGVAALTTIVFGGGGGGGSRGNGVTGTPGNGGIGGGIILLVCRTITITGAILTDGQVGGDGTVESSGGGAAAAGAILLKGQKIILGSSLSASAKAGGLEGVGGNGGNGGASAVGRIHIDYSDSYTGTTSPTLDSRQDLSLRILRGGVAALVGFLAT